MGTITAITKTVWYVVTVAAALVLTGVAINTYPNPSAAIQGSIAAFLLVMVWVTWMATPPTEWL